jgi:hypothetical protein
MIEIDQSNDWVAFSLNHLVVLVLMFLLLYSSLSSNSYVGIFIQ